MRAVKIASVRRLFLGLRGVNLVRRRAWFEVDGAELVVKARVFLGANRANLVRNALFGIASVNLARRRAIFWINDANLSQKRAKKLAKYNRNDATTKRGFLGFAFFIYLDSTFLVLQLLASGFYSI